VTTRQASMSTLPIDSTIGGGVPEEAVQQEGSALLGANAGSS
jgi:hypothetical protein